MPLRQRTVGSDELVTIAVLVASSERERYFDPGTSKVLAEDPLPVS